MKSLLDFNLNFARAKKLHDETVQRAVAAERVRCLGIVEQAASDDSIQSCADAIIFIREGISEEPKPDVYFTPPLRVVVQSLRSASEQVSKNGITSNA